MGRDIITTLDIQMQDIVESALMKMLVQVKRNMGAAL
jgi:hypothetical protein